MLESLAEEVSAALDLEPAKEFVDHADVEKIELGRRDGLSCPGPAKGREFIADQGVVEYVEVGLHGVQRNAGVVGDVSVVQLPGVAESGDGKEPVEIADISRERLRADLFFEVKPDVVLELGPEIPGVDDPRQGPPRHARVDTRLPEFRRNERKEVLAPDPSGEEIDSRAAQLAGAAARQQEAKVLITVQQDLNLVEELREFLRLVHDYGPRALQEPLPEQFRAAAELAERVGFRQVEILDSVCQAPGQGALAGLAGTQEQQRFLLKKSV
jgi:hypothetical protein